MKTSAMRHPATHRPWFEYLEDRVYPGDAVAGFFAVGLGLMAQANVSALTAAQAPSDSFSRLLEGHTGQLSNGRIAIVPQENSSLRPLAPQGWTEQGTTTVAKPSAGPSRFEKDPMAVDFVDDLLNFWDSFA